MAKRTDRLLLGMVGNEVPIWRLHGWLQLPRSEPCARWPLMSWWAAHSPAERKKWL
jgi:hypothetical protein